MAGTVRLFEKSEAGLLVEVDPADADSAREGRRVSRVVLTVDVLWSAEEEAARDAEQAASLAASQAAEEASAKKAAERDSAIQKLRGLGLTDAEVSALAG